MSEQAKHSGQAGGGNVGLTPAQMASIAAGISAGSGAMKECADAMRQFAAAVAPIVATARQRMIDARRSS